MQELVIIGVGGLGRECSQWIEDINAVQPTFRVLGFLDDDSAKVGEVFHDLEVLGDLTWLERHSGVGAIVGIGNPVAKRRVVERVRTLVADFPILRHPRAEVGRFIEIGDGTVVCPGAILTADVRIGRFVTINFGLTIGHDSIVEDYVTLAPGVHLSGYTKIRAGADLGAGVVTIPNAEVGAWTIVGAGAVVTGSLPAHCTAVGVPARVIKTREP
ncbi:MAG TPA: acetyltransferase [Kofleriaceae bacterium]